MLYFAYGSNCYLPRMIKRCPSAKVIGLDTLDKYTLKFNKAGCDGTSKANIATSPGKVHGVVYSISRSELSALDIAEGEGEHYNRIRVKTSNGLKCITYQACDDVIDDYMLPSSQYKWLVVQGLKDIGVPTEYILPIAKLKTAPPIVLVVKPKQCSFHDYIDFNDYSDEPVFDKSCYEGTIPEESSSTLVSSVVYTRKNGKLHAQEKQVKKDSFFVNQNIKRRRN